MAIAHPDFREELENEIARRGLGRGEIGPCPEDDKLQIEITPNGD